jgi:phosphatidylglycerol---prolipoprotein diacylglyceryl transferase
VQEVGSVQFPVYVWLGPLALHPHWVFETLAYLVAGRLYAVLKERTVDPIVDRS